MPVHPTNRKLPFKCEMCNERQLRKPAFIWVSSAQNLTGTPNMRICKKCAIREHGRKNKSKLDDKPKVKDKDDGKS